MGFNLLNTFVFATTKESPAVFPNPAKAHSYSRGANGRVGSNGTAVSPLVGDEGRGEGRAGSSGMVVLTVLLMLSGADGMLHVTADNSPSHQESGTCSRQRRAAFGTPKTA